MERDVQLKAHSMRQSSLLGGCKELTCANTVGAYMMVTGSQTHKLSEEPPCTP